MAGSRYVPISLAEMDNLMETTCGFTKVDQTRASQYVYARPVRTTKLGTFPMFVKVHSSVQKGPDVTREVGDDAIEVRLFTTKIPDRPSLRGKTELLVSTKDWPKAQRKIYRTKSALKNLHEACLDVFWLGTHIACPNPDCRAPMTLRTANGSQFYGCTMYPVCRATKRYEELNPSG